MFGGRCRVFFAFSLSLFLLGMIAVIVLAKEAPRMTKEELKSMLGSPDVIIIDVRRGNDWDKSKEKIKGAIREDPEKNTKSWAEKYSKNKTIVLYCA